jgi:hypothetical protein
VLRGAGPVAGAEAELAEAQVTMRREGAHAELVGHEERLAVVATGAGVAGHVAVARDVAQEM